MSIGCPKKIAVWIACCVWLAAAASPFSARRHCAARPLHSASSQNSASAPSSKTASCGAHTAVKTQVDPQTGDLVKFYYAGENGCSFRTLLKMERMSKSDEGWKLVSSKKFDRGGTWSKR